MIIHFTTDLLQNFQDRIHLSMEEIPNSKQLQHNQFTKWQIIKNLVIICLGFILLFIAFNGLSMLQSTLNQNQGIGVVSQAIIYAGFCISALLLPKYTIKKIGCKNTLMFSMILYIPYIASNFYFNWVTMVPSAILVGLGASILWSSQCTYFNEIAVLYSNLITSKSCDSKMNDHILIYFIKKENEINSNEKQFSANLDCKALCDTNNKIKQNLGSINLQSEYYHTNPGQESEEEVKHNIRISDKYVHDYGKQDSSYSEELTLNQHVTSIFQNGKNIVQYLSKDAIRNIDTKNTSHFPNSCSQNTINTDALNNEEQIIVLGKQLSDLQSEENSNTVASVTARFFGFFGLCFRTSDICSSLMSYYVLNDGNSLGYIIKTGNCSCGAAYCNVDALCFEHNLTEPSQQMRNILTGISVVLGVLAILLVWLFLDKLQTKKKPISFSFSLAVATCKFVSKKEALLLIPLSLYIGLLQGFYIGDFTKSFIACAWGVYHVGLVTITYGVFAGLSSILAGFMVKYIGRTPVMTTGALVSAGVNVFLLVWRPFPDKPLLFFLASSLWGIAVGILCSQLAAFYGVIFKKDEEAAFAGFYLWSSMGYCLSFTYSNYICTYLKIYILLVVSSLGIIGYLTTESIIIDQRKE